MSFLRVFQSILHALEAAAQIAAPIVKAVDPTIGALMTQAAQTAVVVEGTVTASGPEKAALVAASTQASIDLTNSLLASQGKAPLPANIATAIQASTKNVVDTLNAVAKAATASVTTVDPNQSTTSILD